MNKEEEFNECLDQVQKLLEEVADQQAMADDSWKEKWKLLRDRLEDVTGEGFCTFSE